MPPAKKSNTTKKDSKKTFNLSRILLITGVAFCILATVIAALAIAVPEWVYIEETMETTVAGLTDATDVTYSYGLYSYCLTMIATHLDMDDCGSKNVADLTYWELNALATLLCGIVLLSLSVGLVVLNLCCWDKLVLLVLATTVTVLGGIGMIAGVSLYQVEATQQILDIGGLTTRNFDSSFLSLSFWLAFSGCLLSMVAGACLMVGSFTWRPPKPRHKVPENLYKTTIKPTRFAQRHRQPGVMTVTQM